MIIEKIEVLELELDLKKKFEHSLYKRKKTNNIIIKLYTQNNFGIGESLPREYVTGESCESIIKTLNEKLIPDFKNIEFNNYKDLVKYIENYLIHKIKKNELSAFACFETALINLMCKEFKIGIEDILNHLKISFNKKKTMKHTAIMGENNLLKQILKAQIIKHRKFNEVKIKINAKSIWKLKILRKFLKNIKIRVDANCSLSNSNIENNIDILNKTNINIIEQPFKTDDI
ncbi:MAG: hypothetical protein KC589_11350, partial [Nanoarchaeota archaeon]|nr:hypothetical protein [Nanoarchaeota archaeon]